MWRRRSRGGRGNEDGSFNFLFGYMNRNWLEEIDVPVGEDNMFSPGPADRGQPTHFQPRRNRFVFKVRVPADWGEKELVRTLTSQGVTERAYASLRPDYIVDNTVIMSETGALGAGSSNARDAFEPAPRDHARGRAHPGGDRGPAGHGERSSIEDDGLLQRVPSGARREPPGDRGGLGPRRLDRQRAHPSFSSPATHGPPLG